MDFSHVVATNVYLDDLSEFQAMNKIYSRFLREPFPARTTIQQLPPTARSPDEEGRYPPLSRFR